MDNSVALSVGWDFHFIEKANGIKYLYASLNRHPDVRAQAEYDKIHPKLVSKVAHNTFIKKVTIF